MNGLARLSARLKELIFSQPPQDLLGYNWRQLSMRPMFASEDAERTGKDKDSADQIVREERDQFITRQFVLEYVHAVLSGFDSGGPQRVEWRHALVVDSFCDPIIRSPLTSEP